MSASQREELQLFRESVRGLVEAEITPHARSWDEAGALPRELFLRLGEQGLLGIRMPESLGGSDLDFRYTAVLVEELVRCGCVGVPVSVLVHAEFSTKIIERVGSEALKQEFLGPAIAGQRLGALGVTEPDAGSDVAAIRTRAVRDGEHYVVNGAKTFITNGTIADFVTTLVRTGGPGHRGLSLLVIPTETPGLTRSRLRKIGCHASDTAELAFEDCRVPARYLLGEEGAGFKHLMSGFEGERLVLAVICCAQMRLMWESARRYGHERSVFGQPVLAFQTWRHRLADVLTSITAAEALTRHAIDLYVGGEPCNAEISMAKLFSSEVSVGVAHDCAQIYGGNRYMEEYDIGRLQRDSLAFTVGAGSSEVMREIVVNSCGLAPGARA